jgi:hypothetical protein
MEIYGILWNSANITDGGIVGKRVQTVTSVRSKIIKSLSPAMAKTQELLTRVAMCPSSHHGYFYTAAALPCHPCCLRMLKDSHGLAAMLRAGMALAPSIRQKGGERGLECSPPGAVEGRAGTPHVRLTGPTDVWPREKTYARTLADHALHQALPALPQRRAARGRGCGAPFGPPVLLPGACGHARAASVHRPPRRPVPACRLPWGQPAAAPYRRGRTLLMHLAHEGRSLR